MILNAGKPNLDRHRLRDCKIEYKAEIFLNSNSKLLENTVNLSEPYAQGS